MKLIIDAHSWIEYFKGSLQGEKVNELLLDETNEIFTLSITISEVIAKVEKHDGNTDLAYSAMIKNAKIFDVTPKIAKEAGLLYVKIRKENASFGIVDSILISSAINTQSRLVTGDRHFKRFKEAMLI